MILLRALAGFLAAIFLWAAVGNRVVRRWTGELSLGEAAGWSLAAGLLIQATVYAVFLLLSADPGAKTMDAAGIMLLILFSSVARRATIRRPKAEPLSAVPLALILLAAAGAAVFLILAISEPIWGRDYLAVWGFKAKTIFWTGAVPARLFHDSDTAWSHPEYPFLLPLVFGSTCASAGEWNDHALAILYPVFETGLLFSIFGFVRRRGTAAGAAAACLAVAWLFPLFHPYHVGMAEIPLAFALVLFAEAVLDSEAGERSGIYARTILASLLCCGFKEEGSLFVVLTCAFLTGLSLFRRRKLAGMMILCALSPVALQAAAMRLLRGPLSGRDSDWSLLSVSRWGELGHRIGLTADTIAGTEILPRAVPLAAFLALFLVTRRQKADFLLFPLAVQVAFYAAVCAFSTIGPVWQVKTAFTRVAVALFPVFVLPIGARLSALFAPPGGARGIG